MDLITNRLVTLFEKKKKKDIILSNSFRRSFRIPETKRRFRYSKISPFHLRSGLIAGSCTPRKWSERPSTVFASVPRALPCLPRWMVKATYNSLTCHVGERARVAPRRWSMIQPRSFFFFFLISIVVFSSGEILKFVLLAMDGTVSRFKFLENAKRNFYFESKESHDL